MLAKSSVCPGIITIIWSLLTSDVGDDDDDKDASSGIDDELTELINNPLAIAEMSRYIEEERKNNQEKGKKGKKAIQKSEEENEK